MLVLGGILAAVGLASDVLYALVAGRGGSRLRASSRFAHSRRYVTAGCTRRSRWGRWWVGGARGRERYGTESLLAVVAFVLVGSLVAASDSVESYPLAEGQFLRYLLAAGGPGARSFSSRLHRRGWHGCLGSGMRDCVTA